MRVSSIVPRFDEDVDSVTRRFVETLVARATREHERILQTCQGTERILGAQLLRSASKWLEDARAGDSFAATECVDDVRRAFRRLMTDSTFAVTASGRALGAAAGKLVATIALANDARRIAMLLA